MEKDYRRLFSENGMGSTVWSPLAGGILSGKYNDGIIPEGSRYDSNNVDRIWDWYMGPTKKDSTV